MAAVSSTDFRTGFGLAAPTTLGASAQLVTVPYNADGLVVTGADVFSAAYGLAYPSVAQAGSVAGVAKKMTTRGTSAPYQLTIPRPLDGDMGTDWTIILWSSATPEVDLLAVRRGA